MCLFHVIIRKRITEWIEQWRFCCSQERTWGFTWGHLFIVPNRFLSATHSRPRRIPTAPGGIKKMCQSRTDRPSFIPPIGIPPRCLQALSRFSRSLKGHDRNLWITSVMLLRQVLGEDVRSLPPKVISNFHEVTSAIFRKTKSFTVRRKQSSMFPYSLALLNIEMNWKNIYLHMCK